MSQRYEPDNHRIEREESYTSPLGEIVIQTVETSQMPTCTWIHYRTTRDGEELAWGEDKDRVLGTTLLALLGKPKQIKLRNQTQ